MRAAFALSVAGLGLITGCGDSPTGGHPVPAQVHLLSPATQSGTPGWPLSDSVIVEVLDADGNALSGVPVTWTAANVADVVGRPADTTNSAGRASAEWTLGRTEGQQTLSVEVGSLEPVVVTATATIFHAASLTVGGDFACALAEGGQAFCWGANGAGQLGNGSVQERVLVPAPVAGSTSFTSLTASGTHVCGLAADGTALCWGSNENGETGTGTTGNAVTNPTPVQTALRFTQISAEGGFASSTCGLTAAGEAWCWGDNHFAKLGDGTTTSSAVPVRVQSSVAFASIQTGYFHSCGLTATGELWCWGEQEANIGAFGARPAGLYPTPVALQQDFRFTDLSLGRNYTCGLTAEHAAYCWGTDWFGSLGNGQTESAVPLPVVGGHSFTALSAASFEENHALTTDGALYRWGSPGNDVSQTEPIALTDLHFIATDSGDDPFDGSGGACGIVAGNAVYCVEDEGLVRGVPAPASP
jgi:hypothetical protein